MLNAPYDELQRQLSAFIPAARLVTDPLRLLAWGSDASFYRLVPKLVVVVCNEDEVRRVLIACTALNTPVTFRAAGTSLSGQALSDSVLVLLGDGWQGMTVAADASTITLQPGVIGAAANRRLAPLGRKIGPDPASIDAAMIGGIAANNASGMCCGTTQNSYKTLAGLRIVLADGTLLDTRDAASRGAFLAQKPALVAGLDELGRSVREDDSLAAHIRHKYRLKNTTGYGLNALVDYTDPIDILAHLMIGSEGTLAFLSELTYFTVEEHAHKASALILFDRLETACSAVTQLKPSPVVAVELLDRASLRAVQDKAGMPAGLRDLPDDGAALLVETRAATAAALSVKLDAIAAVLDGTPLAAPLRFTTDAAESAALWNVRKGIFPAVGAVRRTGTTVIIEDVAFPVERLAEAVQDLQRLFVEFDYPEAIVYGHALEGNLHFVFTQDFGDAAEVDRYRRFMDVVCELVVKKYDGSLKAEHGTGRNMAPFVEMEWGTPAFRVMQRIKALLDPRALLNPGVILNADPQSHLKNLKPLPAADPIVDKCIECGFCEPKCPSRGLTLSPRQRIVGWREISRLEAAGSEPRRTAELKNLYDYQGIETCAACGLCATACPVGIETGLLIKALRGRSKGPLARQVADVAAKHYGGLTAGVRLGLGAADLLHGVVGTGAMKGALDGLRKLTDGGLPKWSPMLPRPVNFVPKAQPLKRAERLVYFPSCAARNMGAQRGDDGLDMLPRVAERLFQRAGFDVVYPQQMAGLCCGQPFESKGLNDAADHKSRELEAALADASEGGRWPIVFDTSPCAYRMKKFGAGRLPVHDSVEFVHDTLLPRLKLTPQPQAVAVHPVCSVRKMGTADKLMAIAGRCSAQVVAVDQVQCCGFAGERGFMRPELNEHALRHLKAALPAGCESGYATSRTCEIGLSEMAEMPYRSILYLVESCSRENP
ncbi:MAG: FAD-binding and (Fe-S)-binding domain-containing protein [Rubrivivax sp.]|nr:FAD-binding and (Fe-S)-binding domain-containing protein [Rubrivivax sp.]